MKASVMDLRNNMKEILKAVDRNETVTLLYHGKERARIVPLREKRGKAMRMSDHPFCGMWADRRDMKDVEAYVRTLREPRYRDL
jgi:prevent-host-death family protein